MSTFLQINRAAAVPPDFLFFFFFYYSGISHAILSHLRREISPSKDDQSHGNVASREPLCGHRANTTNFRKKCKTERRQGPSRFFYPFFSNIHGYKDTLPVIYQRANSSDVLPDILFIYFFRFNFQGQICVKKKKKAFKGSVVCEFVNSGGLSRPDVDHGCSLNDKKALCQTMLTLILFGPKVSTVEPAVTATITLPGNQTSFGYLNNIPQRSLQYKHYIECRIQLLLVLRYQHVFYSMTVAADAFVAVLHSVNWSIVVVLVASYVENLVAWRSLVHARAATSVGWVTNKINSGSCFAVTDQNTRTEALHACKAAQITHTSCWAGGLWPRLTTGQVSSHRQANTQQHGEEGGWWGGEGCGGDFWTFKGRKNEVCVWRANNPEDFFSESQEHTMRRVPL